MTSSPMDFLFHFSAIIVLPFWLPMIFLPNWRLTAKLVATPWIILPPAICYIALALPHLPELMAFVVAGPTPESMAQVTARPWAASMFWAYAGAFDLFVGRWIFLDSRARKINHLFVAPALGVAVLFGPIGFTLYAIVRALHPPSGTPSRATAGGRAADPADGSSARAP